MKKKSISSIPYSVLEKDMALGEFVNKLKEQWDDLVEEARRDLERDKDEVDFIVYRYALLLFALKHAVPPTHPDYRRFKKLTWYY